MRILDLFSGAGGLSEGFRHAGYQVVAGTEIDPDAAATFALNFPEAVTIVGDLRHAEVHERVIQAARGADVVIGGPPCQAWSQIRNQTRYIDDPRNSLYREFVEIVAGTLPRAFVMENVTGLDQLGVRSQVASDLALDGEYKVSTQMVDSADFGVPQTRKRLLFVGIHRALRLDPPKLVGTNATSWISLQRRAKSLSTYCVAIQEDALAGEIGSALLDPEDLRVVTVQQAISDLDGLGVGNRRDALSYADLPDPASAYQRLMRAGAGKCISNVQVPRINSDTRVRLEGIPQGGNYRDLAEELTDRYLSGQRWGQDNGSGKLSRRHFYAYRRLHPGIWAWTLNTKADSAYHYSVSRALSVREFARLQSFPDSFVFATDPRQGKVHNRIEGGPAHSRYRQVGNAVPPLLSRAVAQALLPLLVRARDPQRQSA